MTDKKDLSERDICTQFITPAVQAAGWGLRSQVREEVSFTKGRVIIKGKLVTRGEAKRADYVLSYRDLPMAIIEAKDNRHAVGAGMQQALGYAETLDIPFAFSSNGDAFLMHDRTLSAGQVEKEVPLEGFPSPEELYSRYRAWKGYDDATEKVIFQPYYEDGSGRAPRYFQQIAVNRTVEAIGKGQDRVLLVMATGTGKTYTAFQIIWRLWKAGSKKRILFLADRNILVDQTISNDFKPFGGKMTKIESREVDHAYEVYLALYQGITGTEEEQNVFKQFSPDFFDLVVVDECHRGSAREDSAWRAVLEYFSNAAHIGLTATPKETEDVSSQRYFGKPVYTYSLKQGIEDGFLAPYRVVRVGMDVDDGWRPHKGQLDYFGAEIPDRIYNLSDFDRTGGIVIRERTEAVAKRISDFLKSTDRFAKTIVFCVDIDHAERMRQALVNENADLAAEDPRYVMRITGDSKEGKYELDNFIDPRERYPVIATTSKLLSTGVDTQTVKVIALDSNIESMTEFKQIIGRGTRINEAYGKQYFTILDFRRATDKFADPDFDGDPVMVPRPEPGDPLPDDEDGGDGGDGPGIPPETPDRGRKIVVGGVPVSVSHERVQYIGTDGKLITESLRDYSKKNVLASYATLEQFLKGWRSAEKKAAVIHALEDNGVFFEDLQREAGKEGVDPFDLVCHVAFDRPALTRRERANNVQKRDVFAKYGEKARKVLDLLLEKYADEGIEAIEDQRVLEVAPIRSFGGVLEILECFGGKLRYREAVRDLEDALYAA